MDLNIIGHQNQWNNLKNIFLSGNMPHGFLFSGQKGLGKKRIALEFVQLINCQDKNIKIRPCGECDNCKSVGRLIHPDLIMIDSDGKDIQINQIRELTRRLSLGPSQFTYKSAIINNAHLMNEEASSALLKTLEEPRGNTVLILIAEGPNLLLPTICSRIQRIRFNKIKRQLIRDYLLGQGVEKKKVDLIDLLSFGRPGVAVSLATRKELFDLEAERLNCMIELMGAQSTLADKFKYAKDITLQSKIKTNDKIINETEIDKDSFYLKDLLGDWMVVLREFLMTKLGIGNGLENISNVKVLERYSAEKLIKLINSMQEIVSLLSTTNINQRIGLEMVMLNF